MKDLTAILALIVLYLIGPVAVYLTGGPIQWYLGAIVLMVILAYLIHRRDPARNLLQAFGAALVSPVFVALTCNKCLTVILVVALLAGVLFAPWWQGALFTLLIAGISIMARELWNLYGPQKKAKPAA